VTNPATPSYCFVSRGGRVPLSAEKYVRHYYPEYTPPSKPESEETEEEAADRRHRLAIEEGVQAAIAKLKDVKLIDVGMLAEAWPKEYREKFVNEKPAHAETEQDATSILPSLAVLTIAPAVSHSVEIGETVDIEAMVWMPGKAAEVKATLRKLSPFPEAGMALLETVIEKELKIDKTQLDLSGLPLSSAQLEKLICSMQDITTVDLSHMSTATIHDVRVILTKFPQL
jgi:hypothetical protein